MADVVHLKGYRLQLSRQIGEGGFARVYLALELDTGKEYVVKRIFARGSEAVAQVKKEVTLAEQLDHPNIVRTLAYGRHLGPGGGVHVLMEHCPGGHLLDVCREHGKRPFRPSKIMRMFLGVCRATAYLHAQDPPIAHRDIKLENVLVGADGAYKLCDFGSVSTRSGIIQSKRERVDEEDIIDRFTTPVYRAPEMVDLYSGMPLDHRVDIWALGCLLYMLCYRKHPFATAGNLGILSARYKLPEGPAFPSDVTDVITRCLSIHPDERPSALTLVDYTEAYLRGMVGDELPPLAPGVLGSALSKPPTLELPPPPTGDLPASRLPFSPSGGDIHGRPPPRDMPATEVRVAVSAGAGAGAGPPPAHVGFDAASVTPAPPSSSLQRRLARRGRRASQEAPAGSLAPPAAAPAATSHAAPAPAPAASAAAPTPWSEQGDAFDLLNLGSAPAPAPAPAAARSDDWGNVEGAGWGGGDGDGDGGILPPSAPQSSADLLLSFDAGAGTALAPAPAPVAASAASWGSVDPFAASGPPAPPPAASGDTFGNADAFGGDPFA